MHWRRFASTAAAVSTRWISARPHGKQIDGMGNSGALHTVSPHGTTLAQQALHQSKFF